MTAQRRDSEGFPLGPWELDSRTAQAVEAEVERMRAEKKKQQPIRGKVAGRLPRSDSLRAEVAS